MLQGKYLGAMLKFLSLGYFGGDKESDRGKRKQSTKKVGAHGSRDPLERLHFGTFRPIKPIKRVRKF
jgi:hypothetical protein